MDKRIYIDEWLKIKPYNRQTVTDMYYLNLCNQVKKAITCNKPSIDLLKHIDPKDINLFSCFLTSYFEDLISGTNIWSSFVNLHKRMYEKELPFYEVDEYYEDETNFQDVCFLIWYFVNTIQTEKMIPPYFENIFEMAQQVMLVFDEAWEYAPENEVLKSYYDINENENDFYAARQLIANLFFKTYLFHPDVTIRYEKEQHDIVAENKVASNNTDMLLKLNGDNTLHDTHTKLLSLKGKDWAAEILKSNHKLKNDFLAISNKIVGYFFYKGQDDKNLFLEHIASGKKFNITLKSVEYPAEFTDVDSIVWFGIVRWKNEWWFSGIYFQQPFNANLILDEKNSLRSRMQVDFLDQQVNGAHDMLKMQLAAFLAFNNGLPIAFLPTNRIDDFNKAFIEFFNLSLNLSKKEIQASKERLKKDGFFDTNLSAVNVTDHAETGLVFFNPKSGLEVAWGINSAFPMSSNPYFEEEKSRKDVIFLLMNKDLSTELAYYCIENCKDDLSFFSEELSKEYLNDIDFLLRFWKSNDYHTSPAVTYMGEK